MDNTCHDLHASYAQTSRRQLNEANFIGLSDKPCTISFLTHKGCSSLKIMIYIKGIPTTSTSNCDDVLNDCDIANKTLGVCSNFEAARKSCAEFCGLCGIGTWALDVSNKGTLFSYNTRWIYMLGVTEKCF